MSALQVLSPGLHTTVQDLGRFGALHLGVPVSGAMDAANLRLANLLVHNDEGAGAIEMIAQGASFEVMAESARFALAGPGARAALTGTSGRQVVRAYESFTLNRGDRLQIMIGEGSTVCYLAVEGGLRVPSIMGSQSTFVLGGMGGYKGRRFLEGDEIPLNRDQATPGAERSLMNAEWTKQSRFRVMLGPQDDYFDQETIAAFLSVQFTISHQSDRMGFRLSGFKLQHSKGFNIASDGIAPGAIQVPGSGEPIILLADRQTTGGYPKIGVLISADLPALGRLGPGDPISFQAVEFTQAQEASCKFKAWFSNARQSISDIPAKSSIDQKALFEQNLIDGVVNARFPHVK